MKKLEISNQLNIDGNTVDMYSNSMYVSSNQSFYGDNLSHAFRKSEEYWPRFFARLEHETSCILFKPRAGNIKLTRVHIAETDNEIAKDIDNRGERWFKVYAEDDGKLRFLIDNSFNLHEFEAVRSRTARPDMDKVAPVFNDIADKETYLPSDTKYIIDGLVKATANIIKAQESETSMIQQVNHNTAWLADNIRKHGPAWFGMSREGAGIRKDAAAIKKEMRWLKSQLAQRTITEFK